MPNHDQQQVERAVQGDQTVLAELLEQAGVALHVEIEHRLAAKHRGLVDADDILQVTYLEAFLRIGTFVWNGPSSFSAWLLRIAENNLRDAIRELERDKRRPPGARRAFASLDDSSVALVDRIIAPITTSSGKASREESKQALHRALAQLPPDYEQVIRLYELDELSGPEVAERMNRSHGAVRMMLGRARARLVELLSSESSFF